MKSYALLAMLAAWLPPVHAREHGHWRRLSDHEHHEHDHGGHGGHAAYEWAGIFEVPDATYMWTAQKVDGAYADATMKIAALPASNATAEQLSALAGEGQHAMEEKCTVLEPGAVITPMEHACYQLRFDADLWQSLYKVDARGVAALAFFTEHFPTEFESTAHYLKDSSGQDVEPVAELPEARKEEAAAGGRKVDWGTSIGAAIIVNLVTLVGVVFAAPGLSGLARRHDKAFEGVMSAFAAGALIACALFLLLFESTHLIAAGFKNEVDVNWRWSTMVLAGFLLPACIESMTIVMASAMRVRAPAPLVPQDVTVEAGAADASEPVKSTASRTRVIGAVVIGDFMHNLTCGMFLGAAIKGCGGSFAVGVFVATVLHEIPQELADYTILTGSSVGMRPAMALLVNFLSGLSVVLGVIIVNAAEVDTATTGLLLAFGGGTYIYLGAVECMPKVHHLKRLRQKLLCMLAFLIGTICIGLILINHEHCDLETPGGSGGHAHHAH